MQLRLEHLHTAHCKHIRSVRASTGSHVHPTCSTLHRLHASSRLERIQAGRGSAAEPNQARPTLLRQGCARCAEAGAPDEGGLAHVGGAQHVHVTAAALLAQRRHGLRHALSRHRSVALSQAGGVLRFPRAGARLQRSRARGLARGAGLQTPKQSAIGTQLLRECARSQSLAGGLPAAIVTCVTQIQPQTQDAAGQAPVRVCRPWAASVAHGPLLLPTGKRAAQRTSGPGAGRASPVRLLTRWAWNAVRRLCAAVASSHCVTAAASAPRGSRSACAPRADASSPPAGGRATCALPGRTSADKQGEHHPCF
jgi:hypothetical protein